MPSVEPSPSASPSPAAPNPHAAAASLLISVRLGSDPAAAKSATTLFNAIVSAHTTWQATATLVNVVIFGPVATAGNLIGPPLDPLIRAHLPLVNNRPSPLDAAVSTAISNAWIAFTASVRVPGLPWYPAFAAVPAPIAPPMPNMPTPFIALTSAAGLLQPGVLRPAILAQLNFNRAAEPTVDAVLAAFNLYIQSWLARTMVTTVIGTGPVPSFAPPVVPVGPVVRGTGTMAPGGLL